MVSAAESRGPGDWARAVAPAGTGSSAGGLAQRVKRSETVRRAAVRGQTETDDRGGSNVTAMALFGQNLQQHPAEELLDLAIPVIWHVVYGPLTLLPFRPPALATQRIRLGLGSSSRPVRNQCAIRSVIHLNYVVGACGAPRTRYQPAPHGNRATFPLP